MRFAMGIQSYFCCLTASRLPGNGIVERSSRSQWLHYAPAMKVLPIRKCLIVGTRSVRRASRLKNGILSNLLRGDAVRLRPARVQSLPETPNSIARQAFWFSALTRLRISLIWSAPSRLLALVHASLLRELNASLWRSRIMERIDIRCRFGVSVHQYSIFHNALQSDHQ
jgi:hypothetical protein